jgi:hypothetical protein
LISGQYDSSLISSKQSSLPVANPDPSGSPATGKPNTAKPSHKPSTARGLHSQPKQPVKSPKVDDLNDLAKDAAGTPGSTRVNEAKDALDKSKDSGAKK